MSIFTEDYEKSGYAFVGYAFDLALNSKSVAIYTHKNGGAMCRVEREGEPVQGTIEQTYSKKQVDEHEGIVTYLLISDFVENEDDATYNTARALLDVICGLEAVYD